MIDIDQIAAQYALDRATSEEMVEVGLFALDKGISSAEAAELAGLTKPLYRRDVEPLFNTVLAQMGKSVPPAREAAFYLATKLAQQIVSAEITPAAGVSAIAKLWEYTDHAEALTTFYAQEDELLEAMIGIEYASDELKKRKEDFIRELNDEIIEYAKKFIASRK